MQWIKGGQGNVGDQKLSQGPFTPTPGQPVSTEQLQQAQLTVEEGSDLPGSPGLGQPAKVVVAVEGWPIWYSTVNVPPCFSELKASKADTSRDQKLW